MKLKVLGMGCRRCKLLHAEAAKAIEASGVAAELEKVETLEGIMAYGVMATPALVVDEEVKCVGRVAPAREIAGWLVTTVGLGAAGKAGRP